MEYLLKKYDEIPFLYSKDNIITKVDNRFINLIGYSDNEIIGKSLTEISTMLRIDSQVCLQNIESEYICYIFTKDYKPIEVTIYCKTLICNNENVYFVKENQNSSVNENLDFVKQFYTDSKTGFSIISVPDLILLTANENYINYFDKPYNKIENIIGKKHREILTGYEYSELEELLNSVITTGKPYYAEEFQHNYFKRGFTYWNLSIVPIFIEGILKYVITNTLDVTNKILDRNLLYERVKVIEAQKEQLEAIIENVSDNTFIEDKESNHTPLFDVNGNITIDASFYKNITDSYNKEKIIKEQRDELETIIENMSDEVIIFDKDGNIIKVNKSARNFFNCEKIKKVNDFYKKAQIFDMNGNLISEENSSFSRILNGENISRYQVVIKNYNTDKVTYTELNGNPIYDSKGNFIIGILLVRDITDRLKSEETLLLKTQYELLSSIIENLDIGFIRYSYPDFKIIDMNSKAYIGLKQLNPNLEPLASVKGQSYFDIFHDRTKNDRIKVIQNLIEKKGSLNYINKKFSLEGEEKFLKIIYNPLFGLNNQICEIIIVAIDVTDEVKAKNKMEETLKIQDEIFSNISHELKTPLTVIFSTNQLMQLYLKNDSLDTNNEKVFKGINIIKQNCYRFTKLINNVIDISKIESGFFKLNLSNENIVNITEDIVQSLSDYVKVKGLNIVFDTNTEEKIIACDPDKIERIILNLISNAIKFTDANGSIFVNLIDKGETVEISVKDTGIGMDKQHLSNIFKRFHQVDKSISRNAEGSGIGLSLVKSIVKLHGGKISVKSKPDEGSIFKIELPAMIIENPKVIEESKSMNSKIEMINIEFSDIYSV